MNLYFLTLLNRDRFERRKMRCSVYEVEHNQPLLYDEASCYSELRKRFRLMKIGDMVHENERDKTYYWDGEDLVNTPIWTNVSDHEFHPYYWDDLEEGICFYFPKSILSQIEKSKFNMSHSIILFEGIKIGKSRFKLIVHFHSTKSWCVDKVRNKIKKQWDTLHFCSIDGCLVSWL